jgi:hypothetical protein
MDDVTILRIRTPPPDKDMHEMEGKIMYRKELSATNKIGRLTAVIVIGGVALGIWTCLYSQSC